MELEPIIARIRAECPIFKMVGGAAEFGLLAETLTIAPGVFVLPTSEDADPSPYANQITQQQIHDEFDVCIAARNLKDRTGRAANEALQPLRDTLFDALLGWVPAEDYDNIEFRRGRFVTFEQNILWWTDTFSTGHLIRSI